MLSIHAWTFYDNPLFYEGYYSEWNCPIFECVMVKLEQYKLTFVRNDVNSFLTFYRIIEA